MMSNDIDYYFGAYIELSISKMKEMRTFSMCDNAHKTYGKFCEKCGMPVSERKIEVERYPYLYDVLDEKYEDVLTEITPPSLDQSGTMLLKGNEGKSGGWLYLSGKYGAGDIEVMTFPTDEEIANMKQELSTNYAIVISELSKSSLVNNLQIKAGYVLDCEY